MTERLLTGASVTNASTLMALAIQDARISFESGIILDMFRWVRKTSVSCSACFAGSVLLQEKLVTGNLGIAADRDKTWDDLDEVNIGPFTASTVAFALNCFRQGHIKNGLVNLYGDSQLAKSVIEDSSVYGIERNKLELLARVGDSKDFDFFIGQMEKVKSVLESISI